MSRPFLRVCAWTAALLAVPACRTGCVPEPPAPPVREDHGPVGDLVTGPLGSVGRWATDGQRATFERGHAVALKRFDLRDGLGPAFNITFCAACHERPVVGGASSLYRNFFLTGVVDDQGAFFPGMSAGRSGGVLRMYNYGDAEPARPRVPSETNVIAQRNGIPFFGVGLIAALPESEILSRADPDDRDGDGISGRPNHDRGFVGRFGLKAQTVSIEGFIRGPLFNHLGITTDPLTDDQKARLPVDSSGRGVQGALRRAALAVTAFAQAAAPDAPLTDDDGVADPEMTGDELFDLVSFAMLLAAPEPEPLNDETRRGLKAFDRVGCAACHTPRLQGPRGALPVYSDLLLHDMGPELADGLRQGEATGSEFRTHPLWGLSAVGPYLHDGRASTLDAAITAHGGEAAHARDAYLRLDAAEREALQAFLRSLGGRTQFTAGLIPPGTPAPVAGQAGGPYRALSAAEADAFEAGRRQFDRDFGRHEGVGSPRLNGDSCRACHFDPVVGGAGPRDVNVMRHGILNASGAFVPPRVGTILHKTTALPGVANRPQEEANVFEHRQTPTLLGLGLVEAIPESTIVARADPDDVDADGISGRVSRTDGNRLGRFGWKAQVPSLEEFVRDALGAELGLTVPPQPGLTFGLLHDNDGIPDPEATLDDMTALLTYLQWLGPPLPAEPTDPAQSATGRTLFTTTGCAACHVPSMDSPLGPVNLYSDLLLHETMPPDAPGIEETSAGMREFRTAPLWGIRHTSPYMHDGRADTLEEAIQQHAGEAQASVDAFTALSAEQQQALLSFLGAL